MRALSRCKNKRPFGPTPLNVPGCAASRLDLADQVKGGGPVQRLGGAQFGEQAFVQSLSDAVITYLASA